MRYILSASYWALIVGIAFWVVFHSILKLTFRYEGEQRVDANLSLAYAAKLEPGIESAQLNSLANQISSIHGVTSVDTEQPIPEWQGPEAQTEEWQELWQTYLPPLIIVNSELNVENYNRAPEIADAIKNVSGVTELSWDEESYLGQSSLLTSLKQKHTFLTTLFFVSLIALTVGLVLSYPERLRRTAVIRLGFGGAGSQVNPERVWLRIALVHGGTTALLYIFLFTIGYLFFPLPLRSGGSPGYIWLFFEGGLIAFIFSSAVCATGWWLHNESSSTDIDYRPPRLT